MFFSSLQFWEKGAREREREEPYREKHICFSLSYIFERETTYIFFSFLRWWAEKIFLFLAYLDRGKSGKKTYFSFLTYMTKRTHVEHICFSSFLHIWERKSVYVFLFLTYLEREKHIRLFSFSQLWKRKDLRVSLFFTY